jgi:hypothetical protein
MDYLRYIPYYHLPLKVCICFNDIYSRHYQMFQSSSEVLKTSARYRPDLHRLITNLTVFQKGAHYLEITLCNKFPKI